MAAVRPDVERIWRLNARLEGLFREWHELEHREWRRAYVPTLGLRRVSAGATSTSRTRYDDEALKAKIAENARPDGGSSPSRSSTRRRTRSASRPRTRTRRSTPMRSGSTRALGGGGPLRWRLGVSLASARERTQGLDALWMEAIAQPA